MEDLRYTFSDFHTAKVAVNDKSKLYSTFHNTPVMGKNASINGIKGIMQGQKFDANHLDSFIKSTTNFNLSKQKSISTVKPSLKLGDYVTGVSQSKIFTLDLKKTQKGVKGGETSKGDELTLDVTFDLDSKTKDEIERKQPVSNDC